MVDNIETLLNIHRNLELATRINATPNTTSQIVKDIKTRINQNLATIELLQLSRPQLLNLKEITLDQGPNTIDLQILIQKELQNINKLTHLKEKSSRILLTIKALTGPHHASIRTAQRLIKSEATISFIALGYSLQSIRHTANINWILKESPNLTSLPLITGNLYG